MDMSALKSSLSAWELVELCALVILAIGVLWEAIHHKWWNSKGGRVLALIMILGSVTVAIAKYRANYISEAIIGRLEDRDLDANQVRQITAELSPFAGKRVLVGSFRGDGEAARIGHKVMSALRAAGIKVNDSVGYADPDTNGGGVTFGIHISGPDSENEFTTTLKNSLGASGRLSVDPEIYRNFIVINETAVHIMIGIKPAS